MPFVNGRFYANPAYGLALERARSLESGHERQGDEVAAKPSSVAGRGNQQSTSEHAKQDKDKQTSIGNRVYNETGGLRPKADAKPGEPGSAEDLHDARVAIADVIQNREKAGNHRGVATDKIHKGASASPQYRDAQEAATEAGRAPGDAGGARNFYLDYGQPQPKWAGGKKTTSYGPFKNAAGGGDVTKGRDVQIVIVHEEGNQ